MKKLFLLLCLSTLFGATVKSQDTDPWTEYMMPSEIHSLLASYSGTFKMEITMWMEEGKEPMVINVNSKHKMLLGERFLEMTQDGNMMGMQYQAVSTIGYNNSSKKVVLTTITNMGTGILSLTGDWDAKTKTAVLTGEMINPVDKKTIKVRQLIRFIDSNTILIENFDQMEGQKEKKSIQYKLTRTK